MSLDVPLLIAVTAAAATAYASTAPHRLLSRRPIPGEPGQGARGDPQWPRAAAFLRPVEGAPGVPTRAFLAVIAGCLALLIAGALGAPVLPLIAIAGGGTFVAAGRFRSSAARSREAAIGRAVPAVCTLLAVCMEAGLPLRNAVAAVAETSDGPLADELRRLAAAIRLGVPEDEAWTEWGERHAAICGLARELRHASGSGVALAPVMRQHAREARATLHAAAQARARRAGVSTVLPLVACFLPAFLLIGVVPVVGGVVSRLFG